MIENAEVHGYIKMEAGTASTRIMQTSWFCHPTFEAFIVSKMPIDFGSGCMDANEL